MNQTQTHTPYREDRQFGEPYADDEQVYRTIGITNAQLGRLPMWARLAIARADADIIRRDKVNADLLAALEEANRCLNLLGFHFAPLHFAPQARSRDEQDTIDRVLRAYEQASAAIAKAKGL